MWSSIELIRGTPLVAAVVDSVVVVSQKDEKRERKEIKTVGDSTSRA